MKNSNFKSEKSRSAPENFRTVLHCDADSFFAACETISHPEYAEVPMAVCGSAEDRHGIVLAKNTIAKKYNIRTGETIWKAKQKCPSLITVRPTYGLYTEVSRKMNRIFYDYTDLIEPFGVDESWLDVTGSLKLFGGGVKIADLIRERVLKELGISVSVGVSFNKVFAKLGSDLKKPNGISEIPPEKFASIVWPLPVSALLFVGPACASNLSDVGIKTIGDLAGSSDGFLSECLGKNGVMLRNFALGRDFAEVTPAGFESEPKSISNGMTFRANLVSKEDISFAVTYLSMSVAERLRKHGLSCKNVSVTIRDPSQHSVSRTVKLSRATCLYNEISCAAFALVLANSVPDEEIYSVSVHAENLVRERGCAFQQQMFSTPDEIRTGRRFSLESTVDSIRSRFGKEAIGIASAINNPLIG